MSFKKIGLSILSVCVFSSMVWGNGFHTSGTDAANFGMATGAMTRAESATAAADLPASIPFLNPGQHVIAGVHQITPEFTFKSAATGESTSTVTDPVMSGILAYAWNTEKMGFGLAIWPPFGSRISWPSDWQGASIIYDAKLAIVDISPTFAYRMGSMSFGIGLDYWKADVLLQTANAKIEGEGSSIAPNASFAYFEDTWNVGFSYHAPTTVTGEGTATITNSALVGTLFKSATSPVEADFLLPSVTRLGFAYKEKAKDPDYFAEWSFMRTGWTNFKELRYKLKGATASGDDFVSVSEKDWIDTVSSQLGGYWVLSRSGDTAHKLRGGISLVDPTPIPSKTLDPFTPDTGRSFYTVGYGGVFGSMTFDVSYLLLSFADGKSTHPSLPGTYGGGLSLIALAVGANW